MPQNPCFGKVFRGLTCRTYQNQQNKSFQYIIGNAEKVRIRRVSMSDMALRLHFGGERTFNRVPADDRADENQAESAHKVPKMTLTMAELADELHISLPTARKLVRKSGFPAFSIGSRILINREGLQRWLDGQPQIAAT